jgi:hypothetical protein
MRISRLEDKNLKRLFKFYST